LAFLSLFFCLWKAFPFFYYQIGVLYEEGKLVQINLSKSMQYFQKAADGELSSGMLKYGLSLEKGYNGTKYFVEAMKNYQKCSEFGYSICEKFWTST
jgi:TPR repeat protein